MGEKLAPGKAISSPADSQDFLLARLRDLPHEVFCCIFLDNRHRVLAFEELFRGTIDNTTVYPREVVRQALHRNAAALILAHNHPSGVPEPSDGASHFALRAARRLGLAPALPTPHDLAVLSAYAWPGNVRELISVIERAAILGDGKRLEVEKALGGGGGAGPSPVPEAGPEPPSAREPRPPEGATTLDGAMVRHIEGALRESHGRIEGPFGAARRLGINPHTLRARMRRLGVDWRTFRE